MKIRTQFQKSLFFLGLYLIFFAIVLVQYPVNKALTGNTDSWFYVGAFKLYETYILSLFVDVPIGEALYPSGPGFMYGDPCFFGALLYRPFCWLGMNELWAWCSMLVVVYATNAFGAFLFFGNWARKNITAFWAGLALGASAFSFGNMDSPNAFYLGTMFFCLHYSNKFLNAGQWKHLIISVVFGSSTLYFSAYIFVFQALLLLFTWVCYYGKVLAVKGLKKKLSIAVILATLLVAPYLFGFLWAPGGISSAWNPVDSYHAIDLLSLDLPDLVRPLEGNLLYPVLKDGLHNHSFFYAQHAVFPGLLFFVLAVAGYIIAPVRSRVWLVLSVIGFIMAVGPCIHIAGVRIPMPMEILYKHAGLDGSIRNPVRLWYLVLVGLIGLTLPAIDKLLDKPKGILLLLLVIGVYVLENVPFKAPKYNATAYVYPDKGYLDVLTAETDAVVLELPSAVYTRGDWPKGLNEFSREYIYMFWQTKHNLNLVNGCNGFLPETRLVLDDMLCRLVDDNTLSLLVQQFGTSVVVFHKNLTLLEDDKRIEAYLRSHAGLQKELETNNTIIYRIKPLP
jgi:hypothetical protein